MNTSTIATIYAAVLHVGEVQQDGREAVGPARGLAGVVVVAHALGGLHPVHVVDVRCVRS